MLDKLRNGAPVVPPTVTAYDHSAPAEEEPEVKKAAVEVVESAPAPRPRAAINLSEFDFETVVKFVCSKLKPEQLFERMLHQVGKEEQIKFGRDGMLWHWSILLFSMDDTSISFFVNRKTSYPELTTGQDYELRRGNEKHAVKFVATFFPSQDFGYGIFSFLRLEDPTPS